MNLQNNLSYQAHLSVGKKPLLPACRRLLGLISRLHGSIGQKTRWRLVNSLIISKISYAICLWGNTSDNFTKKAHVTLNLLGRFVMGQSRLTRQTDIMKACNWLNIEQLTEYHSLIQMHKTVNWGISQYMTDKISKLDSGRISTDAPRLRITEKSYRHKTVSNWNCLPQRLREEPRISQFKRGIRRWLTDGKPGDPPDV